jgi:hypothetical protein
MSLPVDRRIMNPKVECVIIGVMSPEGSEEILVSVRDVRPPKNEEDDENERSGLRFSHIRLSAEAYRSMALMVGDKVTLEMARVTDQAE